MSKINPNTTKEHLVHIYDKINNIENNHLKHIEKDISRLNFILWAIGFMVATQFIAWGLRFFN
jgi:hypothetical protein